jgi:hypothetical protein
MLLFDVSGSLVEFLGGAGYLDPERCPKFD